MGCYSSKLTLKTKEIDLILFISGSNKQLRNNRKEYINVQPELKVLEQQRKDYYKRNAKYIDHNHIEKIYNDYTKLEYKNRYLTIGNGWTSYNQSTLNKC